MRFTVLLVTVLIIASAAAVCATEMFPMLDSLPQLKDFRAMRASSADPNWQNGNGDSRPIPPGETLVLADLKGPGRIAHIWFTINDKEKFYGKKLMLKMFWDDEKFPSVESPLNDFFCEGHGIDYEVNSLPFRVTANGRARNCYFPMPFGQSARIEVTNEGKEPVRSFYYYIDWQKLESLPKDTAYFHAKYRQEFPCIAGKDYLILEALGQGHFVGCNLSIRIHETQWWGEGDDFFYIDGEKEPSIRGTGSEDYLCDAWGIRKMDGLFYGSPFNEGWDDIYDRTTAYRFHITDPVPFKKSLKMTIEHKGAGPLPDGTNSGFKERFDDFSSVAYWYQTEPHLEFFKMPTAEERLYKSDIIEIEGESLIPSSQSSMPDIRTQNMRGGWSGGKQLFYLPTEEDASISVKFSAPSAGPHEMWVNLTRSWDYGKYQILLDDKPIGKPVDLYESEVTPPVRVKLGRQELSSEHTLTFKCVGSNSDSKGVYFGLDLIELLPVK